MYISIYESMCDSRKINKPRHTKGSGIHKHHIVPKHSGGKDVEENFTYLSIREHVIAHFLLWKIHKNPNDLRAMYMLGANLTPYQRKITGEFCRDNNLGIHAASDEEKTEWRRRGGQTQFENNIGIHVQENRSSYASLGGVVGGKVQFENNIGIHVQENRSSYASLGGTSHTGKIWIVRGDTRTRIFPDMLPTYEVDGWIKTTPNKKRNLIKD